MDRKLVWISAIAGVGVLGMLGATLLATNPIVRSALGMQSTCAGGVVAGGAIGGPFELINGRGEVVTDKDVITKPTLVYFGYTYCPDVCPMDTVRNADAVDLLMEQGYEVTPVMISIDPERDTPDVMQNYAENLHERMIGLTGSVEQVKAAASAYRTYYKARKEEGEEFYLVDHLTHTYLMHPERGFINFYDRDLTAEDMAERIACQLDAA